MEAGLTKKFNPDDFCRPCRGKGTVTEQSSIDYRRLVHARCLECNGTGWQPGAEIVDEVTA